MEVKKAVTKVLIDKNQVKLALLDVPDSPGIAAKLFTEIANGGFLVDMIVQSAHEGQSNDIAFTVKREDVEQIKKIVQELAPEIHSRALIVDYSIAKVSIVGLGMVGKVGIASKMFTVLGNAGINIHMINTSEIKISCIVDLAKSEEAARLIGNYFVLEER